MVTSLYPAVTLGLARIERTLQPLEVYRVAGRAGSGADDCRGVGLKWNIPRSRIWNILTYMLLDSIIIIPYSRIWNNYVSPSARYGRAS